MDNVGLFSAIPLLCVYNGLTFAMQWIEPIKVIVVFGWNIWAAFRLPPIAEKENGTFYEKKSENQPPKRDPGQHQWGGPNPPYLPERSLSTCDPLSPLPWEEKHWQANVIQPAFPAVGN